MGKEKDKSNSKNNLTMNIAANVDMASFKKSLAFIKSAITSMQKALAMPSGTQPDKVNPELGVSEMAAKEAIKGAQDSANSAKQSMEKMKKPLTENEILLKKFNEEFNVTGIVGIYAFRRIARFGKIFLKSLIEITIETQKLENGFSSLQKKIDEFNESVAEIKRNLGSAVSSVLEPALDVINSMAGYVKSLTSAFKDMSQPWKGFLGIVVLAGVLIPSVISLVMVLRYYMSKIVKTMLLQAEAGNKAAAAIIKYRTAIATTIKFASTAIILALALYNIFKKTNSETEKMGKNLGVASYDDVNILQDAESTEDKVNGITAAFEKMYKAISLVIAALAGFSLIKTIGGWFDNFLDKNIDDIFDDIGSSTKKATGGLSEYSAETVTAEQRSAALKATFGALKFASVGLIFGFTSLIQNWKEMSTAAKVVSGYLMGLATTLTVVAAGLALVNYVKYKKMITVMGFVAGGLAITAGVVSAMSAAKSQASALNTEIPQQAHGGVTTGTAIAMVGEGKYNEAIVPLGNSPEFSDMKQDITNAVLAGLSMQGGRSNQPINITVNVDKDYIYKSYNQVAKQNGR